LLRTDGNDAEEIKNWGETIVPLNAFDFTAEYAEETGSRGGKNGSFENGNFHHGVITPLV